MHRSGVYKQVTRNSQKRRGSTQRRLFVAVYQVCNNLGQCHCEVGYAPPQCDRPGNGGSQHSGPVSVLHGLSGFSLSLSLSLSHTHTHSVLTAIFPGEPGLAGCPLNSPFPFIPGLRILLGQIGHGLMGVLMHPPHYLHSLVFSFTPGSVDLEKAC